MKLGTSRSGALSSGRSRSLPRTLMSINSAVTGLTVAFVTIAMIAAAALSERHVLLNEKRAQALALADASVPALLARDQKAATAILSGAARSPDVIAVRYTDRTGRVVAAASRSSKDRNAPPRTDLLSGEHRFDESVLSLAVPVQHKGDILGTVQLQADLGPLKARVRVFATFATGVAIVGFVVSLVLGRLLSRGPARALATLVAHTNAVRTTNDYSLRAQAGGTAEIAALGDAINEMLERIQARTEELRRYEARLKHGIEKRTRELRLAKEAAEAAVRAKADFLATMSHEIRTPLNGMLGMTELLTHTRLNDRQRHFAQTAYASGQHLLTLINDILDLSRMEAGKAVMEQLPFDLRELIENVVATFSEPAAAKGIELIADLPPDISLNVFGDPSRLRQVIINLLNNAIKFTECGEIIVRMNHVYEADGRLAFQVEVSDTGVGIPRDKLEQIFEAFSQADNSTTRRFGGSGLGLAISRHIIAMMGGTISVRSQLKGGSTFWFELRLPRQIAASAPALAAGVSGLRAIVMDDNSATRENVRNLLTVWGMTVTPSADASSTLHEMRAAAADQAPYDVLLMDFDMPHTGGLRIVEKLKADPAIAPVRIIMMTSVYSNDAAARREASGIDQWLTKPLRQAELARAIETTAAAIRGGPRVGVAAPTPSRAAEHRISGPRVLLVEDNVVNQMVAAAMLQEFGLEVDLAQNGEEAVQKTAEQEYAMVFMDCQMPVKDGYAATQDIRAREARAGHARLPIIAMTANAFDSDRERCFAAGMDDYLSKPFNGQQLNASIDRWFAPERIRKAA